MRANRFPTFKVVKRDEAAVFPTKSRMSDAGYDLTIIKLLKTKGNVHFYTTGLTIIPEYGYYFNLHPRSSISKTGYMLANSTGIIDSTYTGPLIIAGTPSTASTTNPASQDSTPGER